MTLSGSPSRWHRYLPRTRFLAPNAPQPCAEQPHGPPVVSHPMARRLARGGGASGGGSPVRAPRPAGSTTWPGRASPPERTILLGFSQGTMMALQVGLRRPAPLAGIVGFSGRLLSRSGWRRRSARPPVLLIHGDQDPVVPFASLGRRPKRARPRPASRRRTHVSRGPATASLRTGSASRSASSASGWESTTARPTAPSRNCRPGRRGLTCCAVRAAMLLI